MIVIYCAFHLILSYTILSYVFRILYPSYTFRVIDTLFLVLVYLSYTFSSHSRAMLLISCHIFYTCHFLLGFMSANTLEADTGNNYVYPKVLSLYESVISVC